MFSKMKKIISTVILSGYMFTANYASASIVISGTRIIYPENEKEITVKVSNPGKLPVLTQSWIDNGDINTKPEAISVPFLLTPPLSRINPGKSQTLRLSYTGLPAVSNNKESVYYLNVLEIPPLTSDAPENRLQVAFRTRIKLFYRPVNLIKKEKSQDAFENLLFSTDGKQLIVRNPSLYNVSLVSITIGNGKDKYVIEGKMLSPESTERFSLKHVYNEHALSYEYIDDWGAVRSVSKKI
ncbi:fimbria/pilus periplasmic chaperone [Escherichia coli]|nr:fimbria/pilus periplasmic chaperone [Escherichia coli]MBB8865870.1 fimbria/pilus periplasmic chaperone [Escherichia coli]